jgi:DNA polymerase III subunit alpha
MEALLEFNKEVSRNRDSKQVSLFGGTQNALPNRIKLDKAATVGQQEKLSWEKELLGLYLSAHPFNDFKKQLGTYIVPISSLPSHLNDEAVRTAGVITLVKKIITRSNKPMLFVKIEDAVASTELLVFPGLYETTADLWQDGKVVLVQGKISDKDQEVKLLVDKAAVLSLDNLGASIDAFKKIEVKARRQFSGNSNYQPRQSTGAAPAIFTPAPPLKLIFKKDMSGEQSARLKEILSQSSGDSRVYFKIVRNGAPVIVEGGFRVKNDSSLVDCLKKEFFDSIEVVDAQ